jgi:hypothetical protein
LGIFGEEILTLDLRIFESFKGLNSGIRISLRDPGLT